MKEYRNMEKRAREYSIDIYIHALFETLRKICLNLKWDFKFTITCCAWKLNSLTLRINVVFVTSICGKLCLEFHVNHELVLFLPPTFIFARLASFISIVNQNDSYDFPLAWAVLLEAI